MRRIFLLFPLGLMICGAAGAMEEGLPPLFEGSLLFDIPTQLPMPEVQSLNPEQNMAYEPVIKNIADSVPQIASFAIRHNVG